LKILLVQPFGHCTGHHSIYTEKLTKALIKTGQEVHLATFSGFIEQWTENLPVQHKSFLSPVSKFKSFLIHLRKFEKLVPVVAAIESLLTFLVPVRAKGLNHYDVIHVIDYYPIFFLPFGFARGNVLVVNINQSPPEAQRKNLKFHTKRFIEKTILERLERQIMKKNTVSFICHSKHVEESYRKIPIYKPITTIPWGIDNPDRIIRKTDARKYLDLPQDRRIFLIFGPNHNFKNFKTIFQATEKIEEDFMFIYAGKIVKSDENNNPKWLAQKYGCFENTLIIDKHIPEFEVPYYFYSADALILSYKKNFFGASGVLSYACQFSLPVIASDVGQMGELVRTYNLGLTFEPEDSESLSVALMDFIKLPESQQEKFKDNMKDFMLKNSWDSVAQQHLYFYQMSLNLKVKD